MDPWIQFVPSHHALSIILSTVITGFIGLDQLLELVWQPWFTNWWKPLSMKQQTVRIQVMSLCLRAGDRPLPPSPWRASLNKVRIIRQRRLRLRQHQNPHLHRLHKLKGMLSFRSALLIERSTFDAWLCRRGLLAVRRSADFRNDRSRCFSLGHGTKSV